MSIHAPTLVRPLSVLVVEDNKDGADCLALFLRHCGHQVRLAYDGAHAFQAMRARVYDAVVSDIGLPIKNGYEVAMEARRVLGHRPLLIAVTAYNSETVRESAHTAGFDHIFTKPADPDLLDRMLWEHAERLSSEKT